MPEKISVGIDIGGTNVKFGVVDYEGKILKKYNILTTDFGDISKLAKGIYDDLKSDFNLEPHKLRGIGIGCPVANSKTGCLHHASNLPWKGIEPLQSTFETIFKTKTAITNDANATAIGEGIFGRAKGLENYAVITIGTGIGAGIVSNGKIIDGFDGNGGEFGHIIIERNGRQCGCGRKGCLETYTSANGIVQNAKELSTTFQGESKLKELIISESIINARDIFLLAEQNDQLAIKVFEFTGQYLGLSIANLVTMMGLEKIILYGGPVDSGNYLMNPLKDSFEENVIHFYKNKVKIKPSSLPQHDAAILGAASLVFDKPILKNLLVE